MQPCILWCSELDFLCLHLDILLKIMTKSSIIHYSTKYFNTRTDIFGLSRALKSLQNTHRFIQQATDEVNICLMIQDDEIPCWGKHGDESHGESTRGHSAQQDLHRPVSDSLWREPSGVATKHRQQLKTSRAL